MTYSVSFVNSQSSLSELSRFFNTKKAALNWAAWLRERSFVTETSVYRGELGGELIERKAA